MEVAKWTAFGRSDSSRREPLSGASLASAAFLAVSRGLRLCSLQGAVRVAALTAGVHAVMGGMVGRRADLGVYLAINVRHPPSAEAVFAHEDSLFHALICGKRSPNEAGGVWARLCCMRPRLRCWHLPTLESILAGVRWWPRSTLLVPGGQRRRGTSMSEASVARRGAVLGLERRPR